MKRLALFACLSALGAHALAADLHIQAGSVYVIDSAQAKLSLDKLTIDDKAQIKLGDGVDMWIVDAKEASIGYGVIIDGGGSDGRDGVNGLSHTEASQCQPGKAGGDGGIGAGGTNGASVHWSLGVVSFGTVKVDLSGGNGGRGGTGGDGQNVPDFAKCTAAGGNAGDGGAGGSGGKGGTFRFHYTLADGVTEDLTNSIEVKISGGLRGKGGQPGIAGIGTSGQYVNKKSLSGSRSWVAGGGDGSQGDAGRSGVSGGNGSLDIRLISNGSGATATQAPQKEAEPEGLAEKVKALELLTQKLEARIRLLELDRQ
ncbi:hypothetical protein [Marinagarivorans cellulosilyticus]|uniref:PE-PGRS family protein n=1 Tax=Marinagarivorans cellulosilyticus TaxID=2721545 RepID=A0AAN2BJV5_9GAMM|nr:hypothetical protein [Marinagarivorans cellulosilyticus]BCD97413.1 hypothetical protein MARGE09_P1614 [Marinagarivorans cellulosilyticus]